MKRKNGKKSCNPDYQRDMGVIQDRAVGIIKYSRSEFGEDLHNNKLILKLVKCGKKGCNTCPHGPYWYRAVFIPKARKWVFKYLRSNLNKGLLKGSEVKLWKRYGFYNEEIKKLREDKAQLTKGIKSRR